eukprot:SAG31_NODE_1156_length_9616_cov_26.963014_11_plen_159_part_00
MYAPRNLGLTEKVSPCRPFEREEGGSCLSLHEVKEKLHADPCQYPHITAFVSDVRNIAYQTYKRAGPDSQLADQAQTIERILEVRIGMLSSSLREQASLTSTMAYWRGEPTAEQLGRRSRRAAAPLPLIKQVELEFEANEKKLKKEREMALRQARNEL